MPKNKALYLCILAVIFLIALNFLLWKKVNVNIGTGKKHVTPASLKYVGESILYDVKLGKARLGKSQFKYIENVRINGRLLAVMTAETKLTQFMDKEKIYSDAETALPIKVERDILNWFIREKITEDYDQKDFTVTIVKEKGGKQERLVIKKDSHIHNAILLPYYVRRTPKLDVGRIIVANLPTRRLEIALVSIEEIKVPAGTFKAYHFKSAPKQIEIWISADERRIPLKIQDTAGICGYSMVMREYRP